MAIFSGGVADDNFAGTGDSDQANGNGGNDNLNGAAGNDTLDGGTEHDTLNGGDGSDVLIGGDGTDRLYSHVAPGFYVRPYYGNPIVEPVFDTLAQVDTLSGGAGDDLISAGYGDHVDGGSESELDTLLISFMGATSGVTADFRLLDTQASITVGGGVIQDIEAIGWMEGSQYADFLAPGSGFGNFAPIYGRGGNDHIVGGYYSGDTYGGEGDDIIDRGASGYGFYQFGEGGNDTIIGGWGAERLDGGEGNDILSGDYYWDDLFGGNGDDRLDGGQFNDNLFGEAGNDTLYGAGDADIVEGGDGDDLIYGDYSLISSVDNGFPASNDDTLRGGAGMDVIHGDRGNDTIEGGADADTLYGGTGNDKVDGGTGNDVLHLWDGGDENALGGDGLDNFFFGATLTAADVVNGGAGVDTLVVQGPYGALTLSANITQIENISILGGDNTAFGEPGTNRYDYVLITNNANFAAGVQARINGAALLAGEDFTFNGSAETDASYVVYGGKGKDTLTGGLGNDIFFYAEERFASGDTVNGGAGYDGMFLRGNYTIDFNAPGYTGLFTNIENLTLTSATDERYARGGGTEFDYALTLSNAIVGAGQELTVSGALLMASETMVLDASQEADGFLRLFGGKAGDTLKGGGQADLLLGNLGADILAGNGGADTFRFDSTADSNSASTDHVLDFTAGTDKLDVSRVDSNASAAGDQAFAWIGSGAFTGTAGQLRAVQQGSDWILQGDTNGDGVADLVVVLTLQGPTALGAGDFIL